MQDQQQEAIVVLQGSVHDMEQTAERLRDRGVAAAVVAPPEGGGSS